MRGKKSAFPCMVTELSEVRIMPVTSMTSGNFPRKSWLILIACIFYFHFKFLSQYNLAPEVRSQNS